MKHDIASFENEIVHQILLSQLCFQTCQMIPGIPGLGSHFLPFLNNLCYQRGVASLHSLLLSTESNELSLKNYIKLYKNKYPKSKKEFKIFEKEIKQTASNFRNIGKFPLRNKVVSHIDGDYTHIDFTCAYLMPETINNLLEITRQLKNIFFQFTNYTLANNPHEPLLKQMGEIIIETTKQTVKDTHL